MNETISKAGITFKRVSGNPDRKDRRVTLLKAPPPRANADLIF